MIMLACNLLEDDKGSKFFSVLFLSRNITVGCYNNLSPDQKSLSFYVAKT